MLNISRVEDSQLLQALFNKCDPDGYMTIWIKQENGANKTYWIQIRDVISKSEKPKAVFDDINQAAASGWNVYTSTGTCKVKGRYNQRISSKEADQRPPYQLAAFFMDIDTVLDPKKVEEKAKVPASPEKVLEDLRKLVHAPSLCVCSGHGIHAYWMLDQVAENVTQEELKSFAVGIRDQLNALPGNSSVDSDGVICGVYDDIDTKASEPTRVLRVDGTLNYKKDPPSPVYMADCHPDRTYTREQLKADAAQIHETEPPADPQPVDMATRTDTSGKDYLSVGLEKDAKFNQLWNSRVHSDGSSQDAALMGKIYHWTGTDVSEVIRVFQSSPWFQIRSTEKQQKMQRDDYLTRTAQMAISGHTGKTAPELDAEYQASRKISQKDPDRTVFDRFVMAEEMANYGFAVRLNDITLNMDVTGKTETGRSMQLDDLTITMMDALKTRYKRVSKDAIMDAIAFCARENHYNPVIEYLSGINWDGADRVSDLGENVLHLDPEDTLSATLVRKWLLQSIALLYNRIDGGMEFQPFGADGVLTFAGGQGLGKTQFFKRLAMHPDWFKESGKKSDNDKDDQRRLLTVWIAELGEVETTMNKDIADLKGFISQAHDKYRLPYGRTDTDVARHSSFGATCNSDEYLIDTSGNRRWWTISIDKRISIEKVTPAYAAQLWAQVFSEVSPMTYTEKAACFRLTEDERDQLNNRNATHEKPLKGEVEIRDLIDTYIDNQDYGMAFVKVTIWKEYFNESLRYYSGKQIGSVLKKLGTRSGPRKSYWLPVPKGCNAYRDFQKTRQQIIGE